MGHSCRAPRSARPGKWGSLPFFFRQQPALNAARMHLNSKPLLNGLGQLFGGEPRILGSLLDHKIHYFAGQLVPSLRATFVREQAEHPVLLKCRLRLVEGGARESESMRSFADGLLIHVNLAEHLVLDLQEVVGIEEIAVLKQRVSDRFGLRIERAMPAEGLAL